MEPPLPSPRGFVFWLWIIVRVFWIVVLALPAAALGVFIGSIGLTQNLAVGAQWLTFGLVAVFLGWLAGRHVWKVARGTTAYPEMSMRDEISATLGVFFLLALALAIVWPSFGSLVRKSAEGANKGNLGMLRQDLADFRNAHDGRLPAGLDELGRGRLKALNLWSYKAGTNHKESTSWRLASSTVSADSGEFAYFIGVSSAGTPAPHIYIDCTHTDSRGTAWTAY